MARDFSWTDVRGGLIAIVVLLVGAFAILKFSRVGSLHGDTLRVFAAVSEARGVTPGSEVWLSGQKVGKISRISFRSAASTDTSRRILIEMQVLAEYRDAIHKDATAQIRAGGSLIGAVVVYLSPGTTRTLAVADGDTLRAQPQADVEGTSSQFSNATKELPVIMANVRVLAGQLQTTGGTVGALLNGPGMGRLSEVRIRTERVINHLHGGGTAGLILEGGLSARAGRVMSRADSVRALLASSRTSFGRFRRDSTLMNEVGDIRNELTLIQMYIDEPRGTVGRVLRDSALTNSVADAQREMTLLFADLKKHPTRYLSF